MSISQQPSYDSKPGQGGSDAIDLTGFESVVGTPNTTTTSQTFITDTYRKFTVALSQYRFGSGGEMLWRLQVSHDGSSWYDLVEAYGVPAWAQVSTATNSIPGVKALVGIITAPAQGSFTVPCATPFTRVTMTTDSGVDEGATITVSEARATLTP